MEYYLLQTSSGAHIESQTQHRENFIQFMANLPATNVTGRNNITILYNAI